MRLEIYSDLDKLANKLEKGLDKALFLTSNQVLEDSNYYIPKDRGMLEGSSFVHSKPEEGHIEWNTPYARRLYWNPQYEFSKDSNPNARGLWFEYAKSQHLPEWLEVFKWGLLK